MKVRIAQKKPEVEGYPSYGGRPKAVPAIYSCCGKARGGIDYTKVKFIRRSVLVKHFSSEGRAWLLFLDWI